VAEEIYVRCANPDCLVRPVFVGESSGVPESDRVPCPFCGSRSRRVEATASDVVGLRDAVLVSVGGIGTATLVGEGSLNATAQVQTAEAKAEAFDATVETTESTDAFRRLLVRSYAEAGWEYEDAWVTVVIPLRDAGVYRAEALRLTDGAVMRSSEDADPGVAVRRVSPYESTDDSPPES
jgi:hypothetical protein